MSGKSEKALANLFRLSHKVRFFVPSTVEIDNKVSANVHERHANDIAEIMAAWFGGATQYRAIGSWVSDSAGLVNEQVVIVESSATDEALDSHIVEFIELAENRRSRWSQDAIAIEVNGDLFLV